MNTFDVAIIGGGLIGASIAFELAAVGLRVVLLDRQQPGREASWAAAGMLSPAPDTPRDVPLVPLARQSLELYPAFIAAIEEASGQSTGYAREGTLEIFSAPQGEADRDHIRSEHQRLGLASEPLSLDATRKLVVSLGPAARAALWLPRECTVEPRLLMDAVLAAARHRGVAICPDAQVTSILHERDRSTGVVSRGEKISARHIVLAAGCFSARIGYETAPGSAPGIASENDFVARYAPTRPVRGQMLELRPVGETLRYVLRSRRGYLVPRRDGRIVAGSTLEEAGFQKQVTPAGIRQILDAALELQPGLGGAEILDSWAGLRPDTPDHLPILGPTDMEGLLVAPGHYRNGILLAPVTAKLIREWITDGQASLEVRAFSPLRFGNRRMNARSAL